MCVQVSKEARQLVVDCCTQFIHKMATTSSERCENAAKKTIAPDHVLEALEILGFPEMVPDCRAVLEECRINQQKRRKGSNRLEDAGLSLEELHKQQQRLIDEAKQQQYLEEQQEYQQLHFNHLNMRPVSATVTASVSILLF